MERELVGWSGGVVSGMLGAVSGTYWCSVDDCCVWCCGGWGGMVPGGWSGVWMVRGCLQMRG